MESKVPETQPNKETGAKYREQKPSAQWKEVFRGAWHDLSPGYVPNIIVTLVASLITPVLGVLMNSPRTIVVGIALALTLAIWGGAYAVIRRLPQPTPITVSPKTINLYSQKSTVVEEILVHNSADIAYYSVMVNVAITSPSLKAGNVSVSNSKPATASRDVVEEMNSSVMISTPHPETNSFSFKVMRLGPKETKRYLLERKAVDGLSAADKHLAIISIEKFSTDPSPIETVNYPPTLPPPAANPPTVAGKPDITVKLPIAPPEIVAGQEPKGTLFLANTGTGNALDVSVEFKFDFHPGPLPKNFQPPGKLFFTSGPKIMEAGSVIPLDMKRPPVDESLVRRFRNREITLYTLGAVKFRDVSGKWLYLPYCYTFNPQSQTWDSHLIQSPPYK